MKVESSPSRNSVGRGLSSQDGKITPMKRVQGLEPNAKLKDKGDFKLDKAVLDALPQGSTFISVEHFGFSAFTTPGKLTARNPDGSESVYFVKIAPGASGGLMLKGEFEASEAIYRTTPDFIARPFGFGRHNEGPETYFYLSQFVDMDVNTAPDPAEFTRRLAHLHHTSRSPTGQFGFHVPTYDGNKPQAVTNWQSSWAVFFANLLRSICALDIEHNGRWPEYERAIEQTLTQVVPRLLGPLQADDDGRRHIQPCLIHGDLWEGNVGIDRQTGHSILFDASGYFAHNEMELAQWRCEFSRQLRDPAYTEHYRRFYPPTEPAGEFEDRLRLYCIKGTVNYSVGRPGSVARRTAYNHMSYLCEKYASVEGIDRYDPSVDPWVTGSSFAPHADCPDN